MKTLDIIVVVVWLVCIYWLWKQCRREGRLTTTAWTCIGATSVWWMEAPWDWILYVRYNPEIYALMPADLPVLGMAGGLPWVTILTYSVWFTIPPYFAAKWAVKRDWELKSIFFGALIFGMVDEAVLEITLLISNNVYAYTQVIPGLAISAGTQYQYPLDVPLWMAPMMAFYALTIAISMRTESGLNSAPLGKGTFLEGLWALRSFGGERDGFVVNLFWNVLIAHIIYAVPLLIALYIRYAGLRTMVGDPTPFGHLPWL